MPEHDPTDPKASPRTRIHLVWGVILTLTGIGVFFRIPQVMPEIAKIEFFAAVLTWIRFCFYLLGILLISGGLKKIFDNYRRA